MGVILLPSCTSNQAPKEPSQIIFKRTWVTSIKYLSTWKKYFNIKKVNDFNVTWNFQPIWIDFGNMIRKMKNQFPHFYSQMLVYFHYEILKNSNLSSKLFVQNLWSFIDIFYTKISVKIYMPEWLLIKQTKVMSLRYQPPLTWSQNGTMKLFSFSLKS